MKHSKIYEIKTANDVHNGDTVVAYRHADALRVARKHVGTQLGGARTRVIYRSTVTDCNDIGAAYLDAR